MKNRTMLIGFVIIVMVIIAGIWLANSDTKSIEVSPNTEAISKNIIEKKLDSLKALDMKNKEEANTKLSESEDSSIEVEKDRDVDQNDVVEISEEPLIVAIDLVPNEMYISELYEGDFTKVYDFGSEREESPRFLKEGIEVELYLGNNTQKVWTIEELNEAIDSKKNYEYAATKDAQHIYGFYVDEDKSFADIYKTSLARDDEVLFTYVKTIDFEQKINRVYTLDEVILFELIVENEKTLIFCDLECMPIMGSKTSLDLYVEDILFGIDYWGVGFTVIGRLNDNEVTCPGSFYYGKYEGHHVMAVENEVYENGEPIVDYLMNKDEVGNHYFINTYTNKLISLNQEFRLTDRTLIPAIVLEKSDNDYNNFYLALDYWGVLKKGMIFKNKQMIYYYDYDTKNFMTVQGDSMGNLRYTQGGAYSGNYFYWGDGSKYYKFDEDSKSFILRSDKDLEYETNAWMGEYYVYDDIMYFYDSADIVTNAREDAKRFPDMKPISETPNISYQGEPVFITTTLKVNETEYIRTMLEGLLGTVEQGIFTPIMETPVNRYDCWENGIVYSDHSEVNKAFYYNLATQKTSQLSLEGEALDVQIMDNFAYVLVDNRKIYRFNLTTSTKTQLLADKIIDAKDLVSEERDLIQVDSQEKRYSRLDDNNEYLVFVGSEAGATLILDKELKLYDTLTGSCEFITEDGYIYYGVAIYYSRYEIATKKDTLIHESYFHPILYHKGQLLFNSAYEGSGGTYLKNLYDEEQQFFNKNVDYSIEIAMMYSIRIVIYDHKEKQLDLIVASNGDIKYELTQEGLYYWIEGSTDKKLFPIRKNSKVEIYREKRT